LSVLGCGQLAAEPVATDVNIVTALDISESMSSEEIRLELWGVSQAIRDPRVLHAIQAGVRRRIGFAVFAWHHDQFPVVVSWTAIGSWEDALQAAHAIEARTLVNVAAESREHEEWYIGRLTNLSQAIDHASRMLLTAPFASDRAVINIIGNGDDNVGEDAGVARDRFVTRGGTINGLVLGVDAAMVEYYRREVIGGRAAFVMSTAEESTIVDAFVRKFLGDIVADSAPSSLPRGLPQAPAISGAW
jgi:Ca-activated chloride channel family protein